ncbi:MAG TPA: M23 family metallopeptidase, partial [Chitinophagaceae bacterium]|nr:M23 family metallopeptidase [Chitinophagaceae bacterium]
MFIRLFFCSLLTLFVFSADAQTKYPRGYFRWPLSLAPEIVANLGELRASHWHMGLDIRTAQKVNQRVYAAADGYIARIGVKPLGFGRFLVINHPNGFSTLYAHLNDFAPAIEAYVRSQQQQQESWETELAPAPSLFPVKKGDFISFSGTTGGSQGPHVHFEIRDTKTDKCLNPLLFGMPLQDAVPP